MTAWDVAFAVSIVVANVAFLGLVSLGAYLFATDAKNPESMRQHARRMGALHDAHLNVVERAAAPADPRGDREHQPLGVLSGSAADR